eukprot:1188661-Prorocentrum_minimum.AAC.2
MFAEAEKGPETRAPRRALETLRVYAPLPSCDWLACRVYAPLPSCDRLACRVYALFPLAIGSRVGYMLSSLLRLARVSGICSLPSCDWLACRVYALFPLAIGSRAGYTPFDRRRVQIRFSPEMVRYAGDVCPCRALGS